MSRQLTENDGYEALRAHLVQKAAEARGRHGPSFDTDAIERLLEDTDFVRYPTTLKFQLEELREGEFAYPRPRGPSPADGFDLLVHPHFQDRAVDVPCLVAYHIPSINYLDLATHVEAELFGATLLGMGVEEYYAKLCALADEVTPGTGATKEIDS